MSVRHYYQTGSALVLVVHWVNLPVPLFLAPVGRIRVPPLVVGVLGDPACELHVALGTLLGRQLAHALALSHLRGRPLPSPAKPWILVHRVTRSASNLRKRRQGACRLSGGSRMDMMG